MARKTLAELEKRVEELDKRVKSLEKRLEETAKEARSSFLQTMRVGGSD